MKRVKKAILIMFCLFIALFIVVEGFIIYTANKDYENVKYDYVIVLGAKVYGDDVSSPLKYRLDKTIEYVKIDPNIKIVVSGGKGDDEEKAESTVMKNYLIKNGVDRHKIIEENKSRTTYENFKNSFDIVGKSKILVATNDFHMFRSLLLARKVGFIAQPLNVKTPDFIKFKMYIREVPAFFLSYFFNI
ncbi:MAG: hypothetical protein CSB15_00315 [Clostridiales bacterium]|nr:MAG: hypothetical protein CSB15_00315 [Clostridiales bacterium]